MEISYLFYEFFWNLNLSWYWGVEKMFYEYLRVLLWGSCNFVF